MRAPQDFAVRMIIADGCDFSQHFVGEPNHVLVRRDPL